MVTLEGLDGLDALDCGNSEDCDLSHLMRSTFAYVVVMYFGSHEWLVSLCVIAVPWLSVVMKYF